MPSLMMALNSGLKTAIPHSIRRNVLIPRLTLSPRTPTKMATTTGKNNEQPDIVEHSDQLLMGMFTAIAFP